MLVLTRRVQESIAIGDDIVITVSEIRGDSVRIAIQAPRSVRIFRGELLQTVRDENRQAAQAGPVQLPAGFGLGAAAPAGADKKNTTGA